MQFSESWLRSFVNPDWTTAELSHALTMAGLEVEEERPAAPPFQGVVVAQVKHVEPHPNADKLKVCQVDVGAAHLLQIVCGAPNVVAGMKVPCALVGASLPPAEDGKSFDIKLGKLRGIESHGMLCSARELGLSQDHAGLLALPDAAPVGQDFRAYAQLDDTVFVIKLTPDKGHCLSLLGIAREVAALSEARLTLPEIKPVPVTLKEVLPVRISATDLCGRFSGRVIRGVNAKAPTPSWMKERLERAGQRSISALVDISNYVMLELGRPSHVFDLDKIQGGLEVRWGKAGETLALLNGNTVSLDETIGVIADERGVESLAGMMGGDASAVSLETRHVYVEAAFWWPDAIRGRARRFNFSTDAAHRFERGVDYATTVEHLERISALILEICGGQCGPVDDQAPRLPQRQPVTLRVSRAAKVLGIPLNAAACASVFTRLGLSYTQDNDVFTVTPPSYRFDLEIEEDLIEEVARILGYERIPVRAPVAAQPMKREREGYRSLHQIRDWLAGLGYQETVNYTFVEEAWEQDFAANSTLLRLLNPIASQMSVMRSTLIGSLVQVLKYNLNRRADRVRVFEIGRTFVRDARVTDTFSEVAGIHQPMKVAGLAYGSAWPDQWGCDSRSVDFFDVKGDVEALCAASGALSLKAEVHPAFHPGRSARLDLNGQGVGWVGELHPRWQQKYELPEAPVLFEIDAVALQQSGFPVVQETSRFPLVRRDIAIVVDHAVKSDDLMRSIREAVSHWAGEQGGAIGLLDIVLFDEYRGKGLLNNEKSLAFRLCLQDTRATLQDERVDLAVERVLLAVKRDWGARLR
jgi:phenylalanyl-tRNA synthetase beta chain